jgi:hypothetical protein
VEAEEIKKRLEYQGYYISQYGTILKKKGDEKDLGDIKQGRINFLGLERSVVFIPKKEKEGTSELIKNLHKWHIPFKRNKFYS